jgi:hypothetical protein
VDETGTQTTATATWSGAEIWQLPITDAPGDVRMMRGYLGGTATPATVTVTGLPATSTGYNVYVYTEGDNQTATRTGSYQITAPGVSVPTLTVTDAANTDFTGTYTQGNNSTGNYLMFYVKATQFTLTATGGATSDGYERAPINGIQIVAAPPDFSLTAATASLGVNQGSSVTDTIQVAAIGPFSGTVSLSASNLPSGVTSAPATTGVGSSAMTFNVAAGTATGTYPITISGASGTLTHSISVNLTIASASTVLGKGVISIDFVGGGTPMAASETAGVVARANWNEAVGIASTSALALVDETGTQTTATATWSGAEIWQLPITDAPGDVRMMRGYLGGTATPATVTVTGLPASSTGYNVYVYTQGDNKTATRTGSYQITAPGVSVPTLTLTDAANSGFTGSYTQGNNSTGNYLMFYVKATQFTLTATGGATSDGYERAPINGIQIVAATN